MDKDCLEFRGPRSACQYDEYRKGLFPITRYIYSCIFQYFNFICWLPCYIDKKIKAESEQKPNKTSRNGEGIRLSVSERNQRFRIRSRVRKAIKPIIHTDTDV